MKPNILLNSGSSSNKTRNFYFDNSFMKLNTNDDNTITAGIDNSAPLKLNEASSVVYNNKYYICGGTNPVQSDSFNKSISLYEFDFNTYKWTKKANMIIAKSKMGMVAMNNKLYIVGGNESSKTSNELHEYDIATDKWTVKQPLPTATFGTNLIPFQNKLYLVGGYKDSSYQQPIQEYSPLLNTWSIRNNAMAPFESTASLLDNKIYIFGGVLYGSPYNCYDSIYEYDIINNIYALKQTKLPIAKTRLNSVTYKNKIYIFNGSNPAISIPSRENYQSPIYEYTPSLDKIDTIGYTYGTVDGTSAFSYNNRVYYGITGSANGNNSSNAVSYFTVNEKTNVILDYVEVNEKIFAYQKCKVGNQIIQPNTLTTITTPGYLYFDNSNDILEGYITS